MLEMLAEAHPVWKEEEFGEKDAESYMISYSMYNGSWLVWEKNGLPVAVSYHLEWAPSNGKPWLGTVLVDPAEERKGHARKIIEQIGQSLQDKHRALFTAVPIDRNESILFLSQCGFEQLKTEKDEADKLYIIMVKPLV
ncbi:GNAT family N-acetyltransferase [Bacillus halotolerans]|uniref:GNAT family N-acetyltransferase n=1 Tax=Bacillus TaxID=1386 RepID=UPI000D01A33F|nr:MULTISPECIES: GNAT family N-acetyltransferase [Bacillus]PRP51494.1 GNAT family N-acetyltransferase [Bacillus halotolerans]PRP59866.1 GNAT family N-acetyltransferase [Bacillus halotolerans]PRP64532.1 GNAT family N-acetyltransferase [Bacillus halotolerans]QNH38486.1 GNAT family N-acetyltransferase [Bacillus sp. PAMC26543]